MILFINNRIILYTILKEEGEEGKEGKRMSKE